MVSVVFRIAAAAIFAASAFVVQAPSVQAEETPRHENATDSGSGTDGGPGKAVDTVRTVQIEALDVAFNINEIPVRAGESIRFVVRNTGKQRHEFVIASHGEHLEHRAMMRTLSNMKMGDEPNAVDVQPGETKELIWKFGTDTGVEFACDLPGHAEAGMSGTFRVME